MMYYRRKILLAIMQAFGGQMTKIHFQKLVFIYTRLQKNPSFDFVPYKYGCYSFQANWDMRALKFYNAVEEDNKTWILKSKCDYNELLKKDDQLILSHIFRENSLKTTKELVVDTYKKFPYYAINSTIANRILNDNDLQFVKDQIPISAIVGPRLFTIGYEGISLEKYLNKLIINSVSLLCDVRRNPISQKTGFSKSELKSSCEGVGIKYMHMPQLGIPSDKRQNLKSQSDYDNLFLDFKDNYLVHQIVPLKIISELLVSNQRIALTCFEASHHQCHRSVVACALMELPEWNNELVHL